ncbi:hypothetical protein Tco_1573161, partial [Tanacetum coccineum]
MAGANQHLTYTDKNLVNVIDISYLRIRVSHPNGIEALITKDKQTREPFPLSEHTSTSLGELVHLDLWGPYRVVSKEGH